MDSSEDLCFLLNNQLTVRNRYDNSCRSTQHITHGSGSWSTYSFLNHDPLNLGGRFTQTTSSRTTWRPSTCRWRCRTNTTSSRLSKSEQQWITVCHWNVSELTFSTYWNLVLILMWQQYQIIYSHFSHRVLWYFRINSSLVNWTLRRVNIFLYLIKTRINCIFYRKDPQYHGSVSLFCCSSSLCHSSMFRQSDTQMIPQSQ